MLIIFLSLACCNSTKYSNYLLILVSLNDWTFNFFLITLILFNIKYGIGYFSWCFTIIWLNSFCFTAFSNLVKVKKLILALWLGTLNVHPPIFYLGLILLFIILNSFHFYDKQKLSLQLKTNLYLLFLTLAFGGLWGLQSLAWGYFWVNDGIEWILLVSILLLVNYYHTFIKRELTIFFFFFIPLILTLLLFIRLNIISTRHSFLSSYSLVYLSLFFYFFLNLIIFNTFKINVFITNKGVLSILYILTMYITISNYSYLVLFSKYLYTYIFYFFLKNPKIVGYNNKTRYCHYILFLSLTVWSVAYSSYLVKFMYISLYKSFFKFYDIASALFINSYQNKNILVNTLEFVNFFSSFSFIFLQPLAQNAVTFISLNVLSFAVILFVIFLLFKRVWI